MKAIVTILNKRYLFDVKPIKGWYNTRYHLLDRAGNIIGWCYVGEMTPVRVQYEDEGKLVS